MDRRLSLHQKLVSILGSTNVYFQPPETIKLQHPCIVYERSDIAQTFADNQTYLDRVRYSVTLISRTPENDLVNDILALPYCSYDRYYAADSLSHDAFTIYY